MKKYFVFAVTLLCLVGMAVAAHAREEGTVVVTVPFDFIAGSTGLPAGAYTVSRSSSDTNSPIIISDGNHGSFLLPAAFDDTPVDNIHLSFAHVGDAYLLTEVATQIGTYRIPTGRATAGISRLARVKPQDNMKSDTSAVAGQ